MPVDERMRKLRRMRCRNDARRRRLEDKRRQAAGRAIPRLLPCPFCGFSEPVEITERGGFHLVTCRLCGVEGPMKLSSGAAAIDAWNHRPPVGRDSDPVHPKTKGGSL